MSKQASSVYRAKSSAHKGLGGKKPVGKAPAGKGASAKVQARTRASASTQGLRHRNFLVFGALVGALTLTTALLLALAPAPLTPGAVTSLFAVDTPDSLDAIFNTKVPPQAGHWNYIYIHHSHTPGGDATTLGQATAGGIGDHFVIGNGDGCADGEVQIAQRWNNQQPALPPAGAATIDPACISICLVGDFDHTVPTPVQMRRLTQLVNTLQARFGVTGDHVLMVAQPGSPAGIGRYFPATVLRTQLLK